MQHQRLVTAVCRSSIGRTAICLAVAVAVVPASFAQLPRDVDQGKGGREPAVISVAVPIGRVSVGAEFVDGDPIHVRRTKVREGMTIVEVSTTPFMPVLTSTEKPSGLDQSVHRPEEHPASW